MAAGGGAARQYRDRTSSVRAGRTDADINHDLPLALVATCTALATSPDAGAHYADYQKVDRLLDAAEQSIRESFESAPELAVHHHLAAVNNLIACWTINSARDLAYRGRSYFASSEISGPTLARSAST